MRFVTTALVALIFYLILTSFSGDIVVWSLEELVASVVVLVIVAVVAGRAFFPSSSSPRPLNPFRWLLFAVYSTGPFLLALFKANVDVARRVITGKIRPGIVRISPGLKTDIGITLLAISITLTPGTLTVDLDEETNDLYVHLINVGTEEPGTRDVCGNFADWIRRITE
jgi:multicomponent Na+:H+ antiporter subunit E